MSFRSLLFCPDEAAARLVTQVLSELDFTVETANQSFAAVQRLSEEHFHALVVDCQNEQDASLLFKAARNSAQNSGSLSVAVVEGQAGVAKAFRIGANLVLTKPINVEQSKSTLRVARGLLKKAQPKTAGATPIASTETRVSAPPSNPAPIPTKASFDPPVPAPARSLFVTPPEPVAPPLTRAAAPSAAASVPFSGLVLDSEPEPHTEAADAAVLESLPDIAGKRSGNSAAPTLLGAAEPIAAGSSGQAAAPALAPEPKSAEVRTAGASPMVTNEPIVSTSVTVPEPAPAYEPAPVAPPSFSALERSGSSGGGWFLKVALVLAVVAGGGYFAWQQPRVRQYAQAVMQRVKPSQAAPNSLQNPDSTTADQATTPEPVPVSPNTHEAQTPAQAPASGKEQAAPSMNFNEEMPPETSIPASRAKAAAPENIEVAELPLSRDAKVNAAPKMQPILVKNGGTSAPASSQQPSAPPMDLVANNNSALPSVTPTEFELPKPAPGTIRISQGVSQGLLLKKVQPIYPSMARMLHREGTVQLLATIDKAGDTKKVQVLNGDAMLARSAVDAVKQWKYRPYLLNGSPVEIETQITVVFNGE